MNMARKGLLPMTAGQLDMTRPNISARLNAFSMIQTFGKWLTDELNESRVEYRKLMSEIPLQPYNRKLFFHVVVTEDETWIGFECPTAWFKSSIDNDIEVTIALG